MKIGDQFKQGIYPSVYSLVKMSCGGAVYAFNCSDNTIYQTMYREVGDYENITQGEFCDILGIYEESLHQYTKLDGSPLFPKEIEETYRYGDIFEVISDPRFNDSVGQKLLLCQVGCCKYCLVTVSGTGRGNRWSDPIEPKDNMAITKEELKQMCGSAYSIVLKKVSE